MLAETRSLEAPFTVREHERLEAKRTIAGLGYGHLESGSTVLKGARTTVLQLARLIRLSPKLFTVITNGLALAQEIADPPEIDVIMNGGRLHADNLSSLGPHAEAGLGEFSCNQLFLGATAINHRGVIRTHDADEAAIRRGMLERSDERLLLADSSPFGHRVSYREVGLERVTSLIADARLDAAWFEHWCERAKIAS